MVPCFFQSLTLIPCLIFGKKHQNAKVFVFLGQGCYVLSQSCSSTSCAAKMTYPVPREAARERFFVPRHRESEGGPGKSITGLRRASLML